MSAAPRRVTIKDVAKAAGVVPSTVSQALNDKGYVEAGTKKRILEAAASLGYHPDARARGLRTGGGRTIGLFSAMPFQIAAGPSRLGFLMEIAAVAAETALNKGLALLLVPSVATRLAGPTAFGGQGTSSGIGGTARMGGLGGMGGMGGMSESGVFVPGSFGIDGALVIEPAADDPYVRLLREQQLPVVCLGRYPGAEELPYVDLHSAQTADMLLAHLQEAGCRRIALLVGESRRNSYLETEARYLAFCAAQGIEPLLRRTQESGGENGAHVTTAALLQEHPEIDGLCALVDTFAVGAVQAARACGRSVPEDLKIVTRYDGLRAKTCLPPLTAVDLHLEAVASLGVELLFRSISGQNTPVRLAPPLPTLCLRQSSAHPV